MASHKSCKRQLAPLRRWRAVLSVPRQAANPSAALKAPNLMWIGGANSYEVILEHLLNVVLCLIRVRRLRDFNFLPSGFHIPPMRLIQPFSTVRAALRDYLATFASIRIPVLILRYSARPAFRTFTLYRATYGLHPIGSSNQPDAANRAGLWLLDVCLHIHALGCRPGR